MDDPAALTRVKDLKPEEIEELERTNQSIVAARPGLGKARALFDVLTERNIEILNKATFEGLPERGVTDDGRGINGRALDIFGKAKGGEPLADWKELVSNVIRNEKNNNKWLGELCVAIKDVVAKDRITSIEATFVADDIEGTVILPILYAVDYVPGVDSARAFFVIFVKEIGSPVVGAAGKVPGEYQDYVQIASSIRLGTRFRWEVVEAYKQGEFEPMALAETLDRVMKEADSRLGLKVEQLPAIFEKYGPEGKRVNELYYEFMNTLKELDDLINKKDITTEDIQRIQTILTDFLPVNQEYLQVSTKLFADMNKRMLDEFKPSPAGSE